MSLKRVVITGLGALTPIGNSVDDYWQSLIKGRSGAGPITQFDATHFKTRFACELKDLQIADFIDRKTLNKTDLFTQYAIIASDQAIADANLADDAIDKTRVGVIWASGIGGLYTFQEQIRDYVKRGDGNAAYRFSAYFVPKMIIDIAAGHISIRNGFQGLNFAVVSACASSTNAMIDAFNYIRLGRANVIVTGGSESSVIESSIGGFGAMRALSRRNDDPTTASRPFDLERDGFVMGEGAGALVLEEYEHAKERGATIYAELIGGGLSADAYHLTAPHPNGEGAIRVMHDALDDAQIPPTAIDYINVHGTSTPLGDVSECKAIQSVFGDHAYQLNISSTKSMTGHLLGAAGAIESIATILAVKHDIVPPTINHSTIDPAIDPQLKLTLNKAEKRKVNMALNNTFGFGGHNASVIFKKLT